MRLYAKETTPLVLSFIERAAIARTFAPILVFHPLEDYFPTSSIPPDRNGLTSPQPERWSARVAQYRQLSQVDKLQRAALGYRVFSRVQRGRAEVVVEYWCYYVYNAFTVRGAWLPYRVRDNHPHDLERVYIVLTPSDTTSEPNVVRDDAWARGAFRIRNVIANAHDGSIPPNQYDVRLNETLTPPLTLLVEHGSHAMAPDLNHDGRFTPGIDSTSRWKLQWGIRDRGATWRWYRVSFMDRRDEWAIRLCGPAITNSESCPRYTLYPAADLQNWFGEFQLSSRDRQDIVGRTSWWVRTFGDTRIEHLMVPTDPPDGRMLDEMQNRRTKAEAGFVAGFTTVGQRPALIFGRRTFWDVRSPHAPDVAAEVVALVPNGARPAFEATVWSSYSVDAISNILLGAGWFSKSGSADVVTGLDLRLGRFRLRPAWRVREGSFNSRLTITF